MKTGTDQQTSCYPLDLLPAASPLEPQTSGRQARGQEETGEPTVLTSCSPPFHGYILGAIDAEPGTAMWKHYTCGWSKIATDLLELTP